MSKTAFRFSVFLLALASPFIMHNTVGVVHDLAVAAVFLLVGAAAGTFITFKD